MSETETDTVAQDAPLTIGIIGCSIARPRYGAAIALIPNIRISALTDPDVRFMRAWSKTLGGEVGQFTSTTDLLKSGNIPKALIIDLPMSERAESILAAIPHVRAILAAPPFAPTLEESDRIIHAAEAHGTLVAPAFPRRYDPILAQAIDLATTGEVGLLQQVRCDYAFPMSRIYGAEIGGDPDANSWDSLLQYSAVHVVDVCRWTFGDVLSVSADIDSHSPERVTAGSRDTSPLMANFVLGQENGPSTCHISRSRAVAASERYTFSGNHGHLEAVVASSATPAAGFPVLSIHRTGVRPQTIAPPDFDDLDLPAQVFRMRSLLMEFRAHVRGTQSAIGGADSARAALEIVHAAYASAHDRRKIALPLRRSPESAIR